MKVLLGRVSDQWLAERWRVLPEDWQAIAMREGRFDPEKHMLCRLESWGGYRIVKKAKRGGRDAETVAAIARRLARGAK